MTRSTHDEAVEAAALVHYGQAAPRQMVTVEKIITAYLRHMRAAGFVVTRVPDKVTEINDRNWRHGFNKAIAATLANAVEVPE